VLSSNSVRSGGFEVNHGLGLEKVAECDVSPFPSVSGHFVAAERRLGVFAGSNDVDHAGLDPSGDRCGAILAAGLHIGCGRRREVFWSFAIQCAATVVALSNV
jgi:hypothetical protein